MQPLPYACRKALNGIAGVHATVTLDPPVATVEFSEGEKSIGELQQALSEAGEYKLSEK
ncbi:heavy-metal-associated domain-containing protein [Dysgonomonas sp. 25]|uniref:heavy-metal-associated domain-containing protein n=1 Tax=Dysgonomonas sp. 25 TaxID=2302933 RepID=UPI00351BC24C